MSELSEILGAIGGLRSDVRNLSGTVQVHGEKIDKMATEFSGIKATCDHRLQVISGMQRTIYGTNGRAGMNDQVNSNSKALNQILATQEKVASRFWSIATPIIIAGILGAVAIFIAAWKKIL
jgi:hypothetical protein